MAKDRNPLDYTGRIQARVDMYGETKKAAFGSVTLVAGAAAVSLTTIKTTSIIILTNGALNASPSVGVPYAITQIDGGLQIASYDPTGVKDTNDISDVHWMVFNPEVA